MKHHISFLMISLLIALPLLRPVSAQTTDDTQDPFLALLAMTPDYEDNRTELWYINFEAIAEAWGLSGVTYEDVIDGSDAGTSWQQVMGTTDWIGLWYIDLPTLLPDMQPTMGFTPLDIQQALTAGNPSAESHILSGTFDVQAIRTALANRDFTRVEIGGMEIWCGPQGCEHGQEMHMNNLENGNMFGGYFGRKEPITISPNLVLDSPNFSVMMMLIGVQNNLFPALSESPEYQALAETLAAQGTLLQLNMVDPAYTRSWDFTNIALPASSLETSRASIKAYFGELPSYQLFAFAQLWRDGAYLTQIILIYSDATTAETAATELHYRLLNATSLLSKGGPYYYRDLLAENGEILPPSIYEGENFAAAVFTVQIDSPQDPLVAEAPYRALIEMIQRRDLYFLGTEIISPQN